MKFAHFCDVNIGIGQESGTRWETERNDEKKNVFVKALNESVDKGVSFVLISGGLFAAEPLTEDLKTVNDIFGLYPSIKFIIIAGESDRLTKHSPVLSFDFAENVYYAAGKNPEHFIFEDEDIEIVALSRSDDEEILISALRPESDRKLKIAVCYEESESAVKEAFSSTEFNYVAIGGRNKSKIVEGTNCCYAGGLEPRNREDTGAHGMFLGEIYDYNSLSLQFIELSAVSYVSLRVEITPETTNEELISMLKTEIENRGRKNIYRIKLVGKRNPEMEEDLAEIMDTYRIAELSDETEPMYDFQGLFSEHPQDMIGFYIGAIKRRKSEMSALEKKAMYYGIEALLKTRDKE